MVTELRYGKTNTYLIDGSSGTILLDTDWAGTFPLLCKTLGEIGRSLQEIDALLITHYHPDHMGIAQDLIEAGIPLLVADIQKSFIHQSDKVLEQSRKGDFLPIDDTKIMLFRLEESRDILKRYGIDGQIFSTPGHSDDSISLLLDSGDLFVGDLNPLYELELHSGTQIGDTWEALLKLNPKCIYYGHAKAVLHMDADSPEPKREPENKENTEIFRLVKQIMRYTDKGYPIEKICKKTSAEPGFVEDVMRMYLTHQNVGVQGILDRIEIKNK